MNQEYLWSKKGSDKEIEKLEMLLSDFRFKEGSPPELVADNIIQVKPSTGRRFAWLSAFAATATAAVLVGMWIVNIPEKRIAENETLPVTTIPVDKLVENQAVEVKAAIEPKQIPTLKSLTSPRVIKTVYRTNENSKATSSTRVRQPLKLTKEEKHAYDRLMLALSITSTKLKVVQDTIDRKVDVDQRSIRNEK